MSVRNLDKLFKPRSVALIGATDRAGSVGAVVLRNLRRADFRGEFLLVNRHHQTLDGMPVWPDVTSLLHPPDLAVIATPPATVPGLVGALGMRGTKAAVIITAGLGELGAAGRALQKATLDAARPHLLRLVGPDSVGIMVPKIGLDASFSHLAPPAGDIAFVSQSGAMITAMLDWAAPRGIGFSHVVSLVIWRMSILATCSTISPPMRARARFCFMPRALPTAENSCRRRARPPAASRCWC